VWVYLVPSLDMVINNKYQTKQFISIQFDIIMYLSSGRCYVEKDRIWGGNRMSLFVDMLC